MAIHLEGAHNAQNFPVLKIRLEQGGADAGLLLVRFPEGIDAWRGGDGQHLKFYQDVRSPVWPAKLEAEPVGLPVEWEGDEHDLSYAMRFDNGMMLGARARVEAARVSLSYELQNHTGLDLQRVMIWSCVQLHFAPPLADPLMERTGVLVGGEFQLFRHLIPDFKPYSRGQAVNQRFTGYMQGRVPHPPNPRILPHPGFPDDRGQDISFWHAPRPVEAGAIATRSRDGAWAVVTAGNGVHSVWTNPGISCQHADPAGVPCAPGATAGIGTTIHVIEGSGDALTGFLRGLPSGG